MDTRILTEYSGITGILGGVLLALLVSFYGVGSMV